MMDNIKRKKNSLPRQHCCPIIVKIANVLNFLDIKKKKKKKKPFNSL
jgi:hypothetical protein